jgi:hypothetical protein
MSNGRSCTNWYLAEMFHWSIVMSSPLHAEMWGIDAKSWLCWIVEAEFYSFEMMQGCCMVLHLDHHRKHVLNINNRQSEHLSRQCCTSSWNSVDSPILHVHLPPFVLTELELSNKLPCLLYGQSTLVQMIHWSVGTWCSWLCRYFVHRWCCFCWQLF